MSVTMINEKLIAKAPSERGNASSDVREFSKNDTAYSTIFEHDTAIQGALYACYSINKNDATSFVVQLEVSNDHLVWEPVTAIDETGAAHAGAEVTVTNADTTYLIMHNQSHPELVAFRFWRLQGKCGAADAVSVIASATLK